MKPMNDRAPVRVLVVGMTSTVGGVENFLMAYCGRMDCKRVRFDFLSRYEDAAYAQQRQALGKTYVIPRRSEDPVKYYREIRAFFEQHAKEYDVIWDNECMFNDMTPLKLAAEYGIPVLGKLPIDPKLAALVDKGWIEMMENSYLEAAADAIERKCPVSQDEE